MNMDEQDRFSERITEKLESSLSMAEYDEAKFLPYLEGIDLDTAQKQAFLGILWNMMRSCIEMNVPPKIWGQMIETITLPYINESADID